MEAVLERKITWREFLEMDLPDDGFIYELINGELMRRSSPNPPHQAAVIAFSTQLQLFVTGKKLGRAFTAPLDVFLGDLNGIQPDIFFVSKDREFIIDNQNGIMGAPDLIVEVISPGYVRRDRVEKKEVYEQFAVREYWIIDPDHRTVEIFVMQNNAYILHAFLEKEGKATSTVLEGFEVDIQTLFE